MTGTIWNDVLGRIETKVNRYSYYTWFQHTTLAGDFGDRMAVRVSDRMAVDWLTKHYSGVIQEALVELGRPGVRLEFVTDDGAPIVPSKAAHALPVRATALPVESGPGATPGSISHSSPSGSFGSSSGSFGPHAGHESDDPVSAVEGNTEGEPSDAVGLIPRYLFDTFIVGASNQFAHAACRAVAEAPSRSYNPLFLYGGVGLGKTHLMHAIGHNVLRHNPSLKLIYISGERFMNEVVNAIRYDHILEFREKYRGVDVLLVDDIQFIVGKERTQTEFFHTFNALHDAQKQIVLSSDCPPHQISELEERLRSRFEWGLIADIQPPDLETKMAILKGKAETEGVALTDDVALYIAGRIKSNVRELEGSLIRLLAYASLTGRELSVALAQETLRDVLRREDKVVTIEMIQKFTAEYYQLKLIDLKSRNNSKSIAMPRQVAMYLCKQLTNASLPEIGKSFGGKHHSTVIHSLRKIEALRQSDASFNTLIHSLIETFR